GARARPRDPLAAREPYTPPAGGCAHSWHRRPSQASYGGDPRRLPGERRYRERHVQAPPSRGKRGPMRPPVAVLCSGGLDSAVLLIDLARCTGRAVPLFVRAGHPWEDAERSALGPFLEAAAEPAVAPPRDLACPMADVYGTHWSMSGHGAPGWAAPDEAVELRGRNLVLLSKALVTAAIEGWPTVALGSLAG